jgi:tetratricopeptide (TPR) repeat protein
VPLLERTLELKRRWDMPATHVTGITHYHLAQALQAVGRLDEAERQLGLAIDTHLVGLQPGDARFIFLYGVGVEIALARGDLPAALERSQRALDLAREGDGVSPRGLAIALVRRGDALRQAGRHSAARPLLEEAVSVTQGGGAGRELGQARLSLGRLALDTGDPTAAQAHLEGARQELLAFFGEGHPSVAEVDALLAHVRSVPATLGSPR